MLDIGQNKSYYLTNNVFSTIYSLCGDDVFVYILSDNLLGVLLQKYHIEPLDYKLVNCLFPKEERKISTVNLEVVDYCNLKCIHCYANMDVRKRNTMPESSFYRYVDEISGVGNPVNIKVSGGEPSLNPHIVDFCYAVQDIRPITVHKLLTNLTMSEKMFLNILKTGISLQISIYGCTFEEFSKFTKGSRGQYDTIINNLQSIPPEYANKIHLVFHIPSITPASKESCMAFAESYGLTYHIGGINYIGRAYLNRTSLDAKTAENTEAYPKTFLCNRICERSKICISSKGDVTPCPFFRPENKTFVMGNLDSQCLFDIIHSEKFNSFDNLSIDDIEGCRECPLKYICSGGCGAERLTMTGSILKKYPRCRVNEDVHKLDKNCIYEVNMIKPGFFKFIKGGVIL